MNPGTHTKVHRQINNKYCSWNERNEMGYQIFKLVCVNQCLACGKSSLLWGGLGDGDWGLR